jgi:hypothetical protein
MKQFKLSNSGQRGWFIGDFPEAVHRTKDFEVCYQTNQRGQCPTHVHKELSEITLVLSGRTVVNGQLFTAGDIYKLEPGDIGQVEYLEETSIVTIKTPSIPGDKHLL